MAECKHPISELVGTAEGIRCRACGALLAAMPAVEAPEEEKPKKKGGKKNAGK